MSKFLIILPLLFLNGCIAELALGTASGMAGQLIADKIEAEFPEPFKLRREINVDRNKLLTIKESADYLGISKSTFNKIRQSKNPPIARYMDVGSATHPRYTADDLDRWRDALPTQPEEYIDDGEFQDEVTP